MSESGQHDARLSADMEARGWKAAGLYPLEGLAAWTRDVGDDDELVLRFVGRDGRHRDVRGVGPAERGWNVTRARRSPKMHGRERWHLSSPAGLDLASAVAAAEALPPLVRDRSVDHWSLEALLAAADEAATAGRARRC